MSGLDDRLHGFRECRESGANEAQRQLRGKHFNTVIDKYWPSAADGCPTTRQDRYRPILLKVRQAKPGGVGSHVKENATENF
jgi:hypothetical protein